MKTTYIYELSRNGTPFYVGKTINPDLRIINHKKKRGQNISLILIDEIMGDKTQWIPIESYWIEQYRQWGFELENKNKGGSGRDSIYTRDEFFRNQRESQKKWVQNNKEHILERDRQYYHSNKAKTKQYYQDNKETIIGKNKQRQKENREYILEYQKKWREQNKENTNYRNH